MARSCSRAFASVENVPRFLRFPVAGFFFLEYSRYSPLLSRLIISPSYSGDPRRALLFPLPLLPRRRSFAVSSIVCRPKDGFQETISAAGKVRRRPLSQGCDPESPSSPRRASRKRLSLVSHPAWYPARRAQTRSGGTDRSRPPPARDTWALSR